MNNSCVCFTCKDAKMALLKGRHSLLRYLGFIAAVFACAVIWIGMYLSAIICFYTKCGSRQPANKFGKSFYNIYLSTQLSKYYPHIVSPTLLHVFMWLCMLLTAVWLYVSASLIVDYYKWNKAKRLRKSSKRWIIVTIIVCAVDLLLFLLFIVDFSQLKSGMIGASVRSMDYDNTDTHGMNFDDENDYDPSNRNMFDGQDAENPSDPTESFGERINLIKENLANKQAEIDEKIKQLTDQAAMIVETEMGTYYNPMAQMRTAELQQQLNEAEKLYKKPDIAVETELPALQNEDNSASDKENLSDGRRFLKRNLEETRKGKVIHSSKFGRNFEDSFSKFGRNFEDSSYKFGRNFSKKMVQNSTEHYNNMKNNTYFDKNANSSFKYGGHPMEEIKNTDDLQKEVRNANSSLKYERNPVEELKETDELVEKETKISIRHKFKFDGNSRQISAKDDDAIWRAIFDDDDFGIILQNQGAGIGRRSMEESSSGVDMVLAPSALLMTLAIRGYIVWVFNLTAALMVMYLYITRPRRPTLITRVQA